MSKPSLMIATPCYGGMLHYTYCDSLLNTQQWCGREQIPFGYHLMGNESLITRARNTCAAKALQSGVDILLFIDADVGWQDKDIWRLYYSDKKVIAGVYPIKTLPPLLNFNPTQEHWEKYGFDQGKTPERFAEYAAGEGNECGEVEVTHAATGFMMIDVSVLRDMKDRVEQYESNHLLGRGMQISYDFFKCGAVENRYQSEDWYFSELCQKHGHSVWVNTGVILPHTGTYTFAAGV